MSSYSHSSFDISSNTLFKSSNTVHSKHETQRGKRTGWTRLLPGVWFSGPGSPSLSDWVNAAKLYYGDHIGIGGAAGLILNGVQMREPHLIEVWLPPRKSLAKVEGSRLVPRRDKLDRLERINTQTNATSPGDALADLLNTTTELTDAASAVINTRRAFARYSEQIADMLSLRTRLRHRKVAKELLTCTPAFDSVLEYFWVKQVEAPHGIPPAQRQWRGPKQYIWDGVWKKYKHTLELDGRAFHSGEKAITRDSAKDRAAISAGYTPLHFGFQDVMSQPCMTALQLVRLVPGMKGQGCRPGCPVERH